jgi:2-methylcitrate dehydratase PrpD
MSRSRSGQTALLSDFIHGKEFTDIPAEVIRRTKACLLDWIGSAYAGIGCPSARIVADLIGEMGGRPAATVIGSTQAAPPIAAALYNGTVSAVMEIDDVHEEASLHTGIGVIPAALATAEYAGSPGKDLLAAIVLGYDISVRVARAAGPTHYHFWHTSGTCNTFGAAAAAAKLLRLDRRGVRMALGLAGTQAAGLWESLNDTATMAKHLHSGKAASNGVLAALLARAGYEGSETILEGDKGFLASASKATEEERARLTERLGEPFLIMRNFFKRHACCRAAFEGIEGVGQLLASHRLRPEDVEKITVTMKPSRNWLVAKADPTDIYQAKFSLAFCMAAMALRGDAGLFQFTEENLHDPAIREFMRKVELVNDPAIAVKARIELIDKARRAWTVEPVCQSPGAEEVKEKFIRNMGHFLDEERIRGILSAIERLEQAGKIAELTRLLTTPLSRRVSA